MKYINKMYFIYTFFLEVYLKYTEFLQGWHSYSEGKNLTVTKSLSLAKNKKHDPVELFFILLVGHWQDEVSCTCSNNGKTKGVIGLSLQAFMVKLD